MIDLKNETISIDEKTILRDITLCIKEGEKVALIGPSGAGKTTLLNRLLQLKGKQAAMVHQHLALVPRLSAFHNVYSGRLDQLSTFVNVFNLIKPLKQPKDEIRAILAALSLGDKLFEPVYHLSGGQQQRVAIARAIYRRASVLLGDEPFSAIDPGLAQDVLHEMLNASSIVVLAIHSLELALNNFPRVIGLDNGTILFDCPPSDLTEATLSMLYQHG